jgi:murein DD-endopeptidase MepM/ murein hydrolase activator NlpD
MSRMKILAGLVLVLLLAAGGAWVYAGRGGAPVISIEKPGKFMGRRGVLDLTVATPQGALSTLDVTLEQGGASTPLYSTTQAGAPALKQDAPDRVRLTRDINNTDFPALKSGAATIRVKAERTTLYGLRQLASTATHQVQVRLERPRISVVSMHHFVNHGGAEMVVFRATPAGVQAGVRVGDVTYASYPLAGAGVKADPSLSAAFFALLYDQDLNTPISIFAIDDAGNQATAPLDAKVFARRFRRSRIDVPPQFLQRVVPAILENTPGFTVPDPNDSVGSFLAINRDLRKQNAETIAAYARKSAPQMLWKGAFLQLGNSQVEALFADHRTYLYDRKEIDQQVHLGFDLAVTAAVPVLAANDGRVLHADYLGIYGNCVILDHGFGVQSLYAHLSSMDVKPGDMVQKAQPIGRSGMTGLAGGDHLHFTMLVDGHPVNSVEWWDSHWIEDRVLRKVREAVPGAVPGSPSLTGGTEGAPAPAARPSQRRAERARVGR